MVTLDDDFWEFKDTLLGAFSDLGLGGLCQFHKDFAAMFSGVEGAPTNAGEALEKTARLYTEESQFANGTYILIQPDMRALMDEAVQENILMQSVAYHSGAVTLRVVFGETLPYEALKVSRSIGVKDALIKKARSQPSARRIRQEW